MFWEHLQEPGELVGSYSTSLLSTVINYFYPWEGRGLPSLLGVLTPSMRLTPNGHNCVNI